ncbi:hypothetical protein [Sporosarcina psychrophila]|uniref:Uncharacterized membrane protein YebE (DUF533 family) n=1 Tax=Sporosarcina psychrophila TaxID=1476 RepID=A0ABV2KBN6_SPOPS
MKHVPYNPQTRADSFAQLTAEGMDADRAFVVLTIVAANMAPGMLDGEHMAGIRELARVYTEYTGQESLLVGGTTERGAII